MLRSILLVFLLLFALHSFADNTQEAVSGPGVGEQFPHPLRIADQTGKKRALVELLGENGVVLFFVRSADWCPYCQSQLVEMNARLDDFSALGLNVVSVSVDNIDELAQFASEYDIGYTMLADPKGVINEDIGIRDQQYPLGSEPFGVPRPVIYLLDRRGYIRLRYMEPTYESRPDLDVVLSEAAALYAEE